MAVVYLVAALGVVLWAGLLQVIVVEPLLTRRRKVVRAAGRRIRGS